MRQVSTRRAALALILVVATFVVGDTALADKASQVLTIVAFGDSTTATRRTVKKVYADRLPELLKLSGIEAKVINAGVGGSHTGRLTDNAR
ncbi:MAG: hypothetical protein GY768_08470, partial [Planctomycetaceae bacterium]|nr:hypothetical protein [Planctomycetaceae bacterium]